MTGQTRHENALADPGDIADVARRRLHAPGLPEAPPAPAEGWSNRAWLAPRHVVRWPGERVAAALDFEDAQPAADRNLDTLQRFCREPESPDCPGPPDPGGHRQALLRADEHWAWR